MRVCERAWLSGAAAYNTPCWRALRGPSQTPGPACSRSPTSTRSTSLARSSLWMISRSAYPDEEGESHAISTNACACSQAAVWQQPNNLPAPQSSSGGGSTGDAAHDSIPYQSRPSTEHTLHRVHAVLNMHYICVVKCAADVEDAIHGSNVAQEGIAQALALRASSGARRSGVSARACSTCRLPRSGRPQASPAATLCMLAPAPACTAASATAASPHHPSGRPGWEARLRHVPAAAPAPRP